MLTAHHYKRRWNILDLLKTEKTINPSKQFTYRNSILIKFASAKILEFFVKSLVTNSSVSDYQHNGKISIHLHTYRKEAKNFLNLWMKDKHHILTMHQMSVPSSVTQNSLQNCNHIYNNLLPACQEHDNEQW